MAATVEARRLTELHRVAQVRLADQAVRAMLASFTLLDPAAIDETVARWLTVARPIVLGQRRMSARAAAGYLRAFKRLELGPTAALPVLMELDEITGAVTTSLTVTGPVALKERIGRGVPLARALEQTRSGVAGATIRHVLNGGRDTIATSVAADPDALGWFRVARGDACAFCAMLASRGPVYKSEAGAGFEPHDRCYCEPEPIYRPDSAWPDNAERYAEQWAEAKARAREEGVPERIMFRRIHEGRD